MSNIVPFDVGGALPALPDDLARIGEEMNSDLAGGLQGRVVNRISVRQGRFVFMRGGEVISRAKDDYIDVVIVGTSNMVSRIFFQKGYDPNAPKERPTCWSRDGVAPANDVPPAQRQGNACATCAKNAKGSAADGKSRACAFKKPIVVVPLGGEESQGIGAKTPVPWLLTVNAQSMYDDSKPAENLYSLKGLTELLLRPRQGAPKGVPVGFVAMRISPDPTSTTAKYWFSPMGYLDTPEKLKKSAEMFNSEEVRDLLEMSADESAVDQGDRVVGRPERDRTAEALANPPPVFAAPEPEPEPVPEPVPEPIQSKMSWYEFGLAEGGDEGDLDMIADQGGPGTERGRRLWDKLVGAELTDDIDLSVEADDPPPAPPSPPPAAKRGRGRPPKAASAPAQAPAQATPPPPPPPAPPVAAAPVPEQRSRAAILASNVANFDD